MGAVSYRFFKMKNISVFLALILMALPLSASASEKSFLVMKKNKPLSCNGLAIKIDENNVWTKIRWRGFVVFYGTADDWQIFCGGKDAESFPKKAWEKLTAQQQRAADATARQR